MSPTRREVEAPPLLASLPGDVRPVCVGRLASADARQLAATLLKRASPALVPDAAAIACEADGHPLFIDELVRHAALATGRRPRSRLRLDDALWARVTRLDLAERRVLDIACVIGAPMAQEMVAQAAGLEMREFARAVSILRTSNLARTSGARLTDAIEPYHDRVREAVVARLTDAERRERHQRIASALEASKAADPEVLSVHWAGAGETAKGSRYAVVAAEQAAQALAFDRAARLYQRALDLAPEDDAAPRRALRAGSAWATRWRTRDRGRSRPPSTSSPRRGRAPPEALDLRRRAAEQLLRAGEMGRGLGDHARRARLRRHALPQTTLGAVVALLFYRLILAIRGTRFTSRDESDIAPNELTRLDVVWSVSFTLPYADILRGAVFQTLHVLLALRAGEPLRVARALATEAAYQAARGMAGWPRTERAIARATRPPSGPGHPYARGMALACSGIAHCMNVRFAGAIERLERGIQIFRERCPGSAWEVTTAQFFLFVSLSYFVPLRGAARTQHETRAQGRRRARRPLRRRDAPRRRPHPHLVARRRPGARAARARRGEARVADGRLPRRPLPHRRRGVLPRSVRGGVGSGRARAWPRARTLGARSSSTPSRSASSGSGCASAPRSPRAAAIEDDRSPSATRYLREGGAARIREYGVGSTTRSTARCS